MRQYLKRFLLWLSWQVNGRANTDREISALMAEMVRVSGEICNRFDANERRIAALESQASIVTQLQKELEEVRACQREIQDFRREVVEKSKVVRSRNSSEFRKFMEV